MTKKRFEVPITAQQHEALEHAAEEIGISPRDLARIAIHKFLKEPNVLNTENLQREVA
jgi:hypothetical protein